MCHARMHIATYICKDITGRLNIGDFIQKSAIAKIYSSPLFHLIQYIITMYICISKFCHKVAITTYTYEYTCIAIVYMLSVSTHNQYQHRKYVQEILLN